MQPGRIGSPSLLPPIDIGIDRVVRESGAPADLLPRTDISPSEQPASSQLDALLALPNIDEYIAAELQPFVEAVDILSPARFRSVLDQTLVSLRLSAEWNPSAARALGRAARLLADEASLRDLLLMYRFALLQG